MRALRLVSGPPGAGKSTISRLLATRHARGVHLHADDFWRYVVSGFVEPWLPGSSAQNVVVMSAVVAAAVRFANADYDTFVDGVIGPWFLDPFAHAARDEGLALDYVVLRPAREVAVRRAVARGQGGLAEETPVRHMHAQFADLGALERHVLDTSALSPEETADAVARGLAEGRFALVR